jgi:hypothetical protein
MIFKFPIHHDGCASCKWRFACFTAPACEKDIKGFKHFTVKFYWHIGLSCFSLEPWEEAYNISLDLDKTTNQMVLEIVSK